MDPVKVITRLGIEDREFVETEDGTCVYSPYTLSLLSLWYLYCFTTFFRSYLYYVLLCTYIHHVIIHFLSHIWYTIVSSYHFFSYHSISFHFIPFLFQILDLSTRYWIGLAFNWYLQLAGKSFQIPSKMDVTKRS